MLNGRMLNVGKVISYLTKLIAGHSLTAEETEEVFELFLRPDGASDAQIAAYLTLTAQRLPTSAELVGGARCLRKHMIKVDGGSKRLLDTCGTGGSGYDSFNTSTLSALVVAAAGQGVAKHGNRGATSRCGSADLLMAAGVAIDIPPVEMAKILRKTGFGFFFAPAHHPATKRVGGIRRELGFRTIFNFLGPLANPAGVQYQLLGVSNRLMVEVMAEALRDLGTERAMVVCGEDGLDEITLTGQTIVAEVEKGVIKQYLITPEQFGFNCVPIDEILGGEPDQAVKLALDVLAGKPSARLSLVELNAGAALAVAGKASSIEDGIAIARQVLQSGAGVKVLDQIRSETVSVKNLSAA